MQPVLIDQEAWSLSLSVTLVSPAKTAETTDLLFRLKTRAVPRNHELDGGTASDLSYVY